MKTPDDLKKEFADWKAKKTMQHFDLCEKRNSKESSGEDTSGEREQIQALEKEIAQRKAQLERRLNNLYRRMALAGSSNAAQAARSERAHHLCNLGGLVEKAGLGDMNPAPLLGMLLQQAEYLASNPGIVSRWAERGKAALNESEK